MLNNSKSELEKAYGYLIYKENIKAIKVLSKFIKNNSLNYNAWVYLGIAKRRIHAYEEAIACFKTASKLNKSIIDAWGLLAITYLDQGKIDMAQKILEKAAKFNQFNPIFQFLYLNLIQLWRKDGPFF
ncbi:MAG: tetratricopeptide repeat protein [Promethearchaeota archaeon]